MHHLLILLACVTRGLLRTHCQAQERLYEVVQSPVQNGLYVQYTLGQATDVVTGDFSVGAVGVWNEDGQFAQPVAKVTIASNIPDMLKNLDAVGNDLVFDRSRVCPTYRVGEMTVSGT